MSMRKLLGVMHMFTILIMVAVLHLRVLCVLCAVLNRSVMSHSLQPHGL